MKWVRLQGHEWHEYRAHHKLTLIKMEQTINGHYKAYMKDELGLKYTHYLNDEETAKYLSRKEN